MAKYCGKIGFCKTIDKGYGVWEPEITERTYYGEVLKSGRRWESSGSLNDNILVSNTISIVADQYARENLGYIRYVSWHGNNWEIASIEEQYPRLNLTLGGVFNDETRSST